MHNIYEPFSQNTLIKNKCIYLGAVYDSREYMLIPYKHNIRNIIKNTIKDVFNFSNSMIKNYFVFFSGLLLLYFLNNTYVYIFDVGHVGNLRGLNAKRTFASF